jgi:hypothetical protein
MWGCTTRVRHEPALPSPAGPSSGTVVADDDGRPGLSCAEWLEWHPELGCLDRSSNLRFTHEDRMGNGFVLVSADYTLDGRMFAHFDAPVDDEPGHKNIPVARLSLSPGPHQVSVVLRYRGHGEGVFSYLSGYRFTVRSKHRFVMKDEPQALFVVGAEKEGPTTALEERPRVSFRLESTTPR